MNNADPFILLQNRGLHRNLHGLQIKPAPTWNRKFTTCMFCLFCYTCTSVTFGNLKIELEMGYFQPDRVNSASFNTAIFPVALTVSVKRKIYEQWTNQILTYFSN